MFNPTNPFINGRIAQDAQREILIQHGSFAGTDITIHAAINSLYIEDYQQYKNSLDIQEIGDLAIPIGGDLVYWDGYEYKAAELDTQQMKQQTERYKDINDTLDSFDGVVVKELGEISTLSYSIYREKAPVKVLGKSVPHGFTRGYITIAGTMVFTVFHERILNEFLGYSLNDISGNQSMANLRVDQLPPIDIFVSFENELGARSRMSIYGVEFMNEGQVMSVADLITENSVNYIARHFSPMRRVTNSFPDSIDLQAIKNLTNNPVIQEEYDLAMQQIKDINNRWL